MPFLSKSQMSKCFSLKAKGKNGSWNCDEWAKSTKNAKKLPDHVKKKKKTIKKKMQLAGLVPDDQQSEVLRQQAMGEEMARKRNIELGKIDTTPGSVSTASGKYNVENKGQFGQPNYDHIALSNSIQSIAAFFRENHANKQYGQYERNQFNPIAGYLPFTENTSEQAQVGEGYYQSGGSINKTGYLDGTETANNDYNIIPGGDITMKGVSQPIVATPYKQGKPGKTVVMKPGGSYKFNADYVHEQKMQDGGKIGKASRSDSVAVYNSQTAQNNYYKSKGLFYEKVTPIQYEVDMDEVTQGSLKTLRNVYSGLQSYPGHYAENYHYSDNYGLNDNDVMRKTNEAFKAIKSNKSNGNVYKYLDFVTPQLDVNAPLAMYDKRIKPQGIIDREPKAGGHVPGNIVTTYYYDPIAVKPYDLLTPAEKIIRDKKYGAGQPKGKDVSGLYKQTLTKITRPMGPKKPVDEHKMTDARGNPTNNRWATKFEEAIVQQPQRTKGLPVNEAGAPVVGGIPQRNALDESDIPTTYTAEVGDLSNRSVKYFKTLEDWQKFTDANKYYSRSTSNDGKQAQATMYQDGGEVDDIEREIEDELFGPTKEQATQQEEQPVEETNTEPDVDRSAEAYLLGDSKTSWRDVKRRSYGNAAEEVGDIDPNIAPTIEAFKKGIAAVESGGDYFIGNKTSSAYGKYQFLKGTREQVRKEFFPNISSKDFEQAYKTDPQFQERVMDVYSQHLLATSRTPAEAAIKHFLGPGGVQHLNNPGYNPGGNNINVGSYLNKFYKGMKYEQGGEYEVTEEELQKLKAQGYKFKIQ